MQSLPRFSRLAFALGFVLLAFVVIGGQGCQDPTEVTLSLSLDKRAECSEIVQGTALTVGVDAYDTEERVNGGYVTARTTNCDTVTGSIGTLVVTPTDPGHGAVVVVVGYKGNDPTTCRPPKYDGCIVARRRFVFSKHTRLMMPVLIDPDCASVPCDAFSTCSKGACYDSAVDCHDDGTCDTPGVLTDGGVDEASAVTPDASGFDSGPPPSSSNDSGSDASDASDGGGNGNDGGGNDASTSTHCDNGKLTCANQDCSTMPGVGGPEVCCNAAGVPGCVGTCPSQNRVCCTAGDCDPNYVCNTSGGVPGTCTPQIVGLDGGAPDGGQGSVICSSDTNTLECNMVDCSGLGNACCVGTNPPVCALGMSTCGVQAKYCCVGTDCASGICLRGALPMGLIPRGGVTPNGAGTCSP